MGSVVLTLALLELVLRVAGVPPIKTGHQRMLVEHDAIRGWRNIPHGRSDYSAREYRIRIEYNSRGLRGPERPYAKAPGVYRVVVLGDSFVEGYSVADRDRVTEQLEQLLDGAAGPGRAEVIAFGTAGYSTDQELLWLESEGVRYEPDLVILMFNYNDVVYNDRSRYWRGAKPRFILDNGALTLSNVPVPEVTEQDREQAGPDGRPIWASLTNWVKTRSRLYAVVLRGGDRIPWLAWLTARAGPDAPMVRQELAVFQRNAPAEVERAWDITRALIRRSKQVAERAGARFIVFHIPFRESIYADEWPRIRARYGLSGEDWDVMEVRRRFLRLCDTTLECIEPTERFLAVAAELAAKGDRLYYRYDNHWNPRGHGLAAEILGEHLQRTGFTRENGVTDGRRAAGR